MSARGGIACPHFNTASSLVTKNEGGFIMRKNLKSKVLLSLLAAGVFYLPAYANAAGLTISADTEGNPAYTATESDTADWLHKGENTKNSAIYYVPAGEGTESITDNTIAINSSAFAAYYPNVYGAFTNESGKTLSGNTIKAGNNNGITFTNDLSKGITFKLYGAYANIGDANNYQSTAEKNSVTLNNISFTANPAAADRVDERRGDELADVLTIHAAGRDEFDPAERTRERLHGRKSAINASREELHNV